MMESAREKLFQQGILGIAVVFLALAVVYVGQKWEVSMDEWRRSEKEDTDRYITIIKDLVEAERQQQQARNEVLRLLQANREYMNNAVDYNKQLDAVIIETLKSIQANCNQQRED